MLKRSLAFLLMVTVFTACSKDTGNTKPSLSLRGINGNLFGVNESALRITMNFKDKEGDLGNGTLTWIRNRLNIIPIDAGSSNDKVDTAANAIADFPVQSQGEIYVDIPYSILREASDANDTMVFKVFVTDREGNVSDTVTTEKIVATTF